LALDPDAMGDVLLHGVPVDRTRSCFAATPGNEIARGKFSIPEPSAALVANTFRPFLERPEDLQPPPAEAWGWPASIACLLSFSSDVYSTVA
jgi:hypothetical protein